jgi:hypothetical protein
MRSVSLESAFCWARRVVAAVMMAAELVVWAKRRRLNNVECDMRIEMINRCDKVMPFSCLVSRNHRLG